MSKVYTLEYLDDSYGADSDILGVFESVELAAEHARKYYRAFAVGRDKESWDDSKMGLTDPEEAVAAGVKYWRMKPKCSTRWEPQPELISYYITEYELNKGATPYGYTQLEDAWAVIESLRSE